MLCPNCDTENRTGRNFCGACGGALSVACPACNFVNDPGDLFCGDCGAALGETKKPAEPTSPPVTESEAERRQLTILFCDLVGSTALSEDMDPEDLAHVISAFQDAATEAVLRYDGYVARYMGDGILVYFGYPSAHEDDPERAVRAGLGIINAVSALATGQALRVRVGIATGLVVVGDLIGEGSAEERAVVGETPNLAARMQGLAEPGSVVVAPATRALLGGNFAFRDLGLHDLKGFAEPVRAFAAEPLRETGTRFESYRGGSLSPLVGRKEEITFIRERWALAKTGEGQSIALSGEAGIGKSRILEAIRAEVDGEGAPALHFQCSPHHQTTALYPFIDFLGRAIGLGQGGAPLDRLDELLERAGVGANDAAPLLAELLLIPTDGRYGAPEDDPQLRRNATLRAIADVVFGLGGDDALLAVFEDAHWVDPTSLDLLSMMIDNSRAAKMLFLVTFRPEFEPPWSGMGHVARMTLNRISRAQSTEIVAKLAGSEDIPDQLLEHILAKTEGVPLYVEEMTKALVDSGLLAGLDAGANIDMQSLKIPATLQDSLMARLDRLAPVKEVAQIGAVIGREFGHALLAAIAGLPERELQSAIDSLADAELVFRRGWPPNQVYVFKHALVQDAAYESLLLDKRRRLHEAVAGALETKFPDRTEAEPETLAFHLSESGDAGRAAVYWERAGRRAQDRLSHAEAADHFANALKGAGSGPGSEFDLCLELAASLRVLGRSDETRKILERAQPLAVADADKAKLHYHFGNLYFVSSASARALKSHSEALVSARRAGLAEYECRALSGLADVHYMQGHMVSGHTQSEECVGLARQHGLADVVASNLPAMANLRYLSQGPAAAREIHESGLGEIIAINQPRAEMIIRFNLSAILLDAMEFEAALDHAEQSLVACERIEAGIWLPLMGFCGLRARHAMGKNAAAEIAKTAQDAERLSGALSGPWILGGLAWAAPDADTAMDAMRRAEAIIASGCVAHNQLWFYRDAIDACLRFQMWDKAADYADKLDAFTSAEPLAWSRFFVARGRALSRHGQGRGEADRLKEITQIGQELGFLYSLGAVEVALGR